MNGDSGERTGWGELRERWTEEDVLALPQGEHDYFDRKAGELLSASDSAAELAKHLSAFANSGGGHLVVGVRDDGSVDGVLPVLRGRTATREWIEQRLPRLTEPPISTFRVHAVPIGSAADRVLIVIDIADSGTAPHQSIHDKKYYQRAGGHSVPANHFYLEMVRNRRLGPSLAVSLTKIVAVDARFNDGVMYLELDLLFVVQNIGRSASYRHDVVVEAWPCVGGREGDYVFGQRYPYPGGLPPEPVVLPTLRHQDRIAFDLHLRMPTVTLESVRHELELLLPPESSFHYRVVSEVSPGELRATPVMDALNKDTLAENICRRHEEELRRRR